MRARRLLANLPEVLGAVIMAAITLILFAGVIWRYFLVAPLSWSDEVARGLFVWLAFIGAAIGVKRRMHSSVVLLSTRLPLKWRRWIPLLGLIAIAVMALVLVYTGTSATLANFKQVMPITGIARGWIYLCVPVSGVLMLAYLIPQFRAVLRGAPLAPAHGEPIGTE